MSSKAQVLLHVSMAPFVVNHLPGKFLYLSLCHTNVHRQSGNTVWSQCAPYLVYGFQGMVSSWAWSNLWKKTKQKKKEAIGPCSIMRFHTNLFEIMACECACVPGWLCESLSESHAAGTHSVIGGDGLYAVGVNGS